MRPEVRRFLPDGRTGLLGIVGRPIEHSRSPELHTAVLRLLDRNLIYVPFPVSKGGLPAFFRAAPGLGVVGVNVTTPYKEIAARLVRPADRETERTGMVNTVRFLPEGPIGCGTDGAGILGWLQEQRLGGRPFGVLGFGATARSLVYRALDRKRPLRWIITRRPGRVRSCLTAWRLGVPDILGWDNLESVMGQGVQRLSSLWISSLPPDVQVPAAFWRRLPARARIIDLNYGPGRAGIRRQAIAHGFPAGDGLGPLCHQAALSLSFWLGVRVPVRLFHEAAGSLRALRSSA